MNSLCANSSSSSYKRLFYRLTYLVNKMQDILVSFFTFAYFIVRSIIVMAGVQLHPTIAYSISTNLTEPNAFDGYLGVVPTHRLSRKRRSGLTACVGTCDPQPLGKNDIPGSEASGYRVIRQELTWKDAHDHCEENHGHLASFIDERYAKQVIEAIFLKSKFDEDYDWGRKQEEWGLDRRYWIGLTDIMEEGKWAWVGKGKLLTYQSMWYPNQPDHVKPDGSIKSGRRQHCVSLWNPAYWKVDKDKKPTERHSFDDVECSYKFYSICEDDPTLVDSRKNAAKGGGAPPPAATNTAPAAAAGKK